MTATPASVTPEALTSAEAAIYQVLERVAAGRWGAGESLRATAREAATEALTAAGPVIARAERACIWEALEPGACDAIRAGGCDMVRMVLLSDAYEQTRAGEHG